MKIEPIAYVAHAYSCVRRVIQPLTSVNQLKLFFLVKQGTPTNDELEELGVEIAEKWMKLGRRLGVKDPKLQDIRQAHDELCEKGYHMLIHWKQKKGSAATYQVLCDALHHNLVQRADLAEQFCYIDGNYSLQR